MDLDLDGDGEPPSKQPRVEPEVSRLRQSWQAFVDAGTYSFVWPPSSAEQYIAFLRDWAVYASTEWALEVPLPLTTPE